MDIHNFGVYAAKVLVSYPPLTSFRNFNFNPLHFNKFKFTYFVFEVGCVCYALTFMTSNLYIRLKSMKYIYTGVFVI